MGRGGSAARPQHAQRKHAWGVACTARVIPPSPNRPFMSRSAAPLQHIPSFTPAQPFPRQLAANPAHACKRTRPQPAFSCVSFEPSIPPLPCAVFERGTSAGQSINQSSAMCAAQAVQTKSKAVWGKAAAARSRRGCHPRGVTACLPESRMAALVQARRAMHHQFVSGSKTPPPLWQDSCFTAATIQRASNSYMALRARRLGASQRGLVHHALLLRRDWAALPGGGGGGAHSLSGNTSSWQSRGVHSAGQ